MLDIAYIRDNPEIVKKAVTDKKFSNRVDVDRLLELDAQLLPIKIELNDVRQKRNELDKKIKFTKDLKERQQLIDENTRLKNRLKSVEVDYVKLNEQFEKMMLLLPNVTSPKMPVGKDENENTVIRKWGTIPKFSFAPRNHIELGKRLNIIDVEKSSEVSGARFYYLKNEAVRMQFAIIQIVFQILSDTSTLKSLADKTNNPFSNAFVPVIPPVMIKPEIMRKMDRLDPIEERYELKKDDLILVGSAEHTLGPMHMNETFAYDDLPKRYIGYSTAFRREAGSYGKDMQGILRVHQFDKLEMESFVPAEYGEVEQDFIVAIQEYLVQQLGLPYQVIQICTGDTGKPDYNQYDIECWIPSQNKYRETHTSDYMTDYQSRRLNIRYIDNDKNKKFVHMNDATAFAISRILIAILENFQQEDGSVLIPKVLQPLCGFDKISNIQ